jgi:dephospho-CoA kinase
MIHVSAPTSLRIERVMQRDRVSKERVEQRMKHQWKDEQKNALADCVIVNDGSPILKQVEAAIQKLLLEVND